MNGRCLGSSVLVLCLAMMGLNSAPARADDDAMTRIESIIDKLAKLKISGYVQARWETGEAGTDTASVSGSTVKSANDDRFYIRRARVKVQYDASPTSSGVVYFDGGADRDVLLLEAYATLTEPWSGERRHTLTFGQMTVPFGFEVQQSSSRRELPERSLAENRLFPGERDRGATLTSRWFPQIETTVGIFNGGGIKDASFPTGDPTRAKDWLVRGVYEENRIRAGATWYQGKALVPLTGPDVQIDRTRLGLDGEIGFELGEVGASIVRGELYSGKNPNPDSLKALTTSSGGGTVLASGADRMHLSTDVLGGYAMVVQNFGKTLQLVARYDYFDPNTDREHDQFERFGFGANYFWDAHTRITLAYDIPITEVGANLDDPADNLWTLQFQHKF